MRSLMFAVAGVLGLAGAAQATTPPDPDFPILGGSFGQIMRVTVAAVPPDACRVMVRFRVGLQPPPDPDRLLDLVPGQVGATDLDLSRFASRFGARVEVQPTVRVLLGRCSASVETVEVFTRRTTAFLRLFTGLATPPDPEIPPPDPEVTPPDPDFAPMGVALGQIVRFGVVRDQPPPDPEVPADVNPVLIPPPCRGTFAFFDARGTQIGSAMPIDLAPGQFAFASLDPRAIGSIAVPSPRTIVQPRLVPDDAGSLAGCRASVQVFDALTGWTTEAVGGR